MVNRIKKLMDIKNLTAAQFSEAIDVQRSSLSHVLSGRNRPSLDFVLKIKNAFTDINLNWLLLGKGEIFSELTGETLEENKSAQAEVSQKEIMFDNTKDMDDISVADTILGAEDAANTSRKVKSGYQKKTVKVVLFYDDNSFEIFDEGKL